MNDDGEGDIVPEYVVFLPLDSTAATVPVGLIVIVVNIGPFVPRHLSNNDIDNEFVDQ